MTLSSTFTADGAAITSAVEVAYAGTVALALTSTTDVSTIAWTVEGSSDSALSDPTILPADDDAPTFTMIADPADGKGAGFRVQCKVTDAYGNESTSSAVIGAVNSTSGVVPCATGETTERDSDDGWGGEVNGARNDNLTDYGEHDSTGAVAASAVEWTLADDTLTMVSCRVVTHETAGTNDYLVREWSFGYSRKLAAAPIKDVADSDGGVYLYRDDATWTATVDLNGNDFRIRVLNDAANNCTSKAWIWVTEIPIV